MINYQSILRLTNYILRYHLCGFGKTQITLLVQIIIYSFIYHKFKVMLSVIVGYKESNNHQVSDEVSLTFTKMVFQQLRELVQPSKPNIGSNLEILDSILVMKKLLSIY